MDGICKIFLNQGHTCGVRMHNTINQLLILHITRETFAPGEVVIIYDTNLVQQCYH